MADSSRAYTRDETWRVVLTAWKSDLFLCHTIGATITAEHWEEQRVWLFFTRPGWVAKPVDSIDVSASFEGILPTNEPGIARRGISRQGSSQPDVRYFAFGAGLQLAPEVAPAGPGGAADPLTRAVRATGSATIGNEHLPCKEVSAQ